MQRCPRNDCNRAGDDLGTCADVQVLGCPRFVDVTKADAVFVCQPCGITRAFPIGSLMTGKKRTNDCQGHTDNCRAVIMPQKAALGAPQKSV